MSDESKPGIPTVEQVRKHADRYPLMIAKTIKCGAWMAFDHDRPVLLALYPDTWEFDRLDTRFVNITDWTPCDQQGNPVGLVDRCEAMNRARLHEERLHFGALQELDEVRARLRQAARRVLALGRDVRRITSEYEVTYDALDKTIDRCKRAESERDTSRAQLEEAQRTIAELRERVEKAEADVKYWQEAWNEEVGDRC